MPKNHVISFPHLGNYHVVFEYLVHRILPNCEIRKAPPTTKRTLELGSKHSPDFVCVPFKYNMGNFIEALENGATILLQTGGGCRYGYFGESQKQILNDMGYEFDFICLAREDASIKSIYQTCKRLGSPVSFPSFLHSFFMTMKIVGMIDKIEFYIREHIGFQKQPGQFETLHRRLLETIPLLDNINDYAACYKQFEWDMKKIPVEMPENPLRVGLVGELYTLMEPFSNFFIEKELAKNNIAVSRYINVTYLVFQKWRIENRILRDADKYLKYKIGADGTNSIAKSRILAEKNYDGLIHVKPFGCTPEINAMPALQNIGRDYQIPVLYFSFDSQTSETGVKTRLEAFTDMLEMRREKQYAANLSRR